MFKIPRSQDIHNAVQRIEPWVHRTPVLHAETFNKRFESNLYFKCENFQKVGAFKSRGAVNAVFSLSDTRAARGVATHSSGNHAQALARAASLRNIPAYIVMPENAPKVKVAAVKAYGGKITFCKPTLEARESTLKKVIQETGAVEIHPYDNLAVITGQATAAYELLQDIPDLDLILCPVGGGGLLSGTALSAHYFSEHAAVVACEPAGADDAYQSFYGKHLVPSVSPNTIADGLLTSLGEYTYPIMKQYVKAVVTVTEESIVEAMRLIFERMKIVVEPSSAVPFAAILENKVDVQAKNVGLIVSGGNVDLERLPWLV
jgi:threonine dehydratase